MCSGFVQPVQSKLSKRFRHIIKRESGSEFAWAMLYGFGSTHGLQSSSFWGLSYYRILNINHKKKGTTMEPMGRLLWLGFGVHTSRT